MSARLRPWGQFEHHQAYYEFHGKGPHYCYFCDELVSCDWWKREDTLSHFVGGYVNIHHIDRNHRNNYEDNIAMCHNDCHGSYHAYIRKEQKRRDIAESRLEPMLAA